MKNKKLETNKEQPLLVYEKLADVGEKLIVRKPLHWGIFIGSALLGFAPIVIGLLSGVTTVIGSVRFPDTIPWWGGIIGVAVTLYCIAGIILHLYAITEAEMSFLWSSLAFSLIAWPAVALLAFFLTYVMPADDSESADSYTANCKMPNGDSKDKVSSKDCILN